MTPACLPISRRTLLAGAGAVAGSLLVGWRDPAAGNPEAAQASETDLAVWIRLHPDGIVTVYTAQTELGQGVMTALPALVAEELGVEWSAVTQIIVLSKSKSLPMAWSILWMNSTFPAASPSWP